MKSPLRFLSTLALLAALAAPAHAGTWIFAPSYYSHDPAHPVEIGPRSYGGPLFSRPQGVYVRGGYRYSNSSIVVGGNTIDHLNIREWWVQGGEQY